MFEKLRLIVSMLALAAGLVGAAPSTADKTPSAAPIHEELTREGIALDLTVEPLDESETRLREGDAVRVRLRVEDDAGRPMTSLYPAGWMDLLPTTGDPAAGEPGFCKEKVQAFVGGTLLAKPEVDLNVYYVITLNQDATLSVVDPLFGFGGSKLLEMVFLDSPGKDWELTEDQRRLFVSMPDSNRVAVVRTSDWEVHHEIDVGARPGLLAIQPDGHYLWVVNEGDEETPGSVSVIDTRDLTEAARIETGRGSRDLAFRDDDAYAFVANAEGGSVSVVDVGTLEKVARVDVPRPVALAYSELGDALLAVDSETGEIVVVDGEGFEVAERIAAEPGVEQIRFSPDGRLGFVVNPRTDRVHVVDPASRRIVQTGIMEEEPYDVHFSDELAYVVHRGSETVLMMPLSELGEEGRPIAVIDFPGGQSPPGRTPRHVSAETVVQAPGATAVLVANPGDEAIYYYKEGMAAPMGHFKNYGRPPLAVQVVDRSFQEIEPGVYETVAKLSRAGDYDLAMFVDSPRVVHCVGFQVAENPELARERRQETVAVGVTAESTELQRGEPVDLTVRVRDPENGTPREGLEDVRVLTFLSPGIWQKRTYAEEVGGGEYRVRFTPPRHGIYYVFVEIASEGLDFNRSPSLILSAEQERSG